jgi:hypothetical protein
MDKQKQYDCLVEISAHARLLLAHSDDNIVLYDSMRIYPYTIHSIEALGFSKDKFEADVINRYLELNNSLK